MRGWDWIPRKFVEVQYWNNSSNNSTNTCAGEMWGRGWSNWCWLRSPPSSTSSSRPGSSSASVHVAEADELDDGEEAELQDGQEVMQTVNEQDPNGSLEDDRREVSQPQSAFEVVATELDQAAASGCDEEELNGLVKKMDDAVEALVALREAHSQISALKQNRGYHGNIAAWLGMRSTTLTSAVCTSLLGGPPRCGVFLNCFFSEGTQIKT